MRGSLQLLRQDKKGWAARRWERGWEMEPAWTQHQPAVIRPFFVRLAPAERPIITLRILVPGTRCGFLLPRTKRDKINPMIPDEVKPLFWDVNLETFSPLEHPDYVIFRVLEYGDVPAVYWMRQTFPETEVRRVLLTEGRLTPKSANFWALVYKIPSGEIAALMKCDQI